METLKAVWTTLQASLGDTLPGLLGGLSVLLLGWMLAVGLRAGTRKALVAADVNKRMQLDPEKGQMDLEGLIARIVYWTVLILALVGFFSVLDLKAISTPLQGIVDKVLGFLPSLIAGGLLAVVAWSLASVARFLINKGLSQTTIDDQLSTQADMAPVSESIGNVAFWLVVLLFLPAILGVLKLDGMLDPIQGMVDKLMLMLPNIFGAVILGVAGWFVARILRDLVVNLLKAVGADELNARLGMPETMSISRLTGTLVFVFVFVPAVIASLNVLQIDAISEPATAMLSAFMSAIPDIFAALIILGMAIVVSRFVAELLDNILAGAGANEIPAKIGLSELAESDFTLSRFVGKLASFFLILFAVVESSNQLGFEQVSETVAMFIQFGGQILLGSTILGVGFWLAGLARLAIIGVSGEEATQMASMVRIAILLIVSAMGLRAMGIADDIVNTAFTLILGAVAVALALSFGLGGREAAGKQMDYWLAKMRS